MSSTTVPEQRPVNSGTVQSAETEPLLGRPGDAAQQDDASLLSNLSLGTGIIAELGAVLLFLLIWASVFTKPLTVFSGHPLAQSLGILILLQSALVLQPTHTPEQKRTGQLVHASLNFVALLILVAGVVIIEYYKISHHGAHFHSAHGYLGVITFAVFFVQYLVGVTMWATPKLYGGEARAKAIWKYHRMSGYVLLLLLLATVNAAAKTEFNEKVLHIKLWATICLSILIVIGVGSRVQKYKLGFKRPNQEV